MRHALFALGFLASGCGPTGMPVLSVDVTTDLSPGVDFTRVRTELSEQPFGAGELIRHQDDHLASANEDYGEGLRVADVTLMARPTWHLRVRLLDASGRIRGERLATVEIRGNRSISIVIGSACNGVACPGPGDPDDATACLNGVCVPSTCTPEDPTTCPPVGCTEDATCAEGFDCQRPACVDGSCLVLDVCLDGEICVEDGCVPAPSCGDTECDASTETPCACPEDCGACPAGCMDGDCAAGETPDECPEDCGPPPSACGDGICESGEVCFDDCPFSPPPACGDPGCTTCEECDLCCDAGCGDGVCNEPPEECPFECGGDPTVCGDTRCDVGESCPGDCDSGAICGDNVCADGEGESCGNCQPDCGWCGLGWPKIAALSACTGPSGTGRGAVCAGIFSGWTDAADNAGYYPMQTVRSTPLASGERPGQILAMLSPLTTVAIQSTRNPLCRNAPPLRPSTDGWVFGYVRGASSADTGIGWMRMADLILDASGGPCANGPAGGAFQVATNPYSRSPICEQFDCTGERTCRAANPRGEGATECDGTEVSYDRIVDFDTLILRYSPAGSPRRFLHRGDRVHVRYESPDHNNVFVVTETTQAPRLTPVGARGWVRASALRMP